MICLKLCVLYLSGNDVRRRAAHLQRSSAAHSLHRQPCAEPTQIDRNRDSSLPKMPAVHVARRSTLEANPDDAPTVPTLVYNNGITTVNRRFY